MKKLLKTLTAILVAVITLVSVACSPNTPPANADAEIENSEQLAYSLNRLENADVSFSFKESKTSSQNLLHSVGNATVSNGLATSSYSTQTYSSNADLIIDATKNNMHVEEGSIGWMESRTESISETAERAQDTIDTLLDTITVMDKFVIDDEFCQGSMLSYNEQTDIVTAYVISYVDSTYVPTTTVTPDGGMIGSTQGDNPFLTAADGTIKNAYKIMVYDDAEGNEVVEWWDIAYMPRPIQEPWQPIEQPNESTYTYQYVKYSEYKEYVYECGWFFNERYVTDATTMTKGIVSFFRSKNIDGKWSGIETSMGINLDGRFMKVGNTSESGFEIRFFYQVDTGYYVLPVRPTVYRYDELFDRMEKYYGPIDSYDEVVLECDMLEYVMGLEVLQLPLDLTQSSSVSLAFKTLTGWEKVYIDANGDSYLDYTGDGVVDQNDYPMISGNPIYLNGDDYIEFTNGKKYYWNTVWSEKDGFVRVTWEDGAVFEDGRTMTHDEWNAYVENANYKFLGGGEKYEGAPKVLTVIHTGKIIDGWIDLIDYGGKGDYLQTVKAFMAENQLGFSNVNSNVVFQQVMQASRIKDVTLSRVFERFSGKKLSIQNLVAFANEVKNQGLAFISEVDGIIANSTRIREVDLPKIPSNFAFISITGRMTGNATVVDGKLDLSAITITVPKRNILRKGHEYGICVYLEGENGVVLQNAFDTKAYNRQTLTFKGNGGIDLPDLKDGEYQLKLLFGKPTENGFIRLSNLLPVSVSAFEDIQKTVDIDGASYDLTYYAEDNTLKATSKIIDTNAPEFTYEGTLTEEDGTIIHVETGTILADIILGFNAQDDVDGKYYITEENFTCDDQAVELTHQLDSQKTYKLTITDGAGNQKVLEFRVQFING